jgi:SAM-dependent methyltransferase
MVVTSAAAVWHDLECGSYRADLPLWQELAAAVNGPVLDVGAGTGRVTLDLAHAGHRVTALDIDPDLLGVLQERAGGLRVETVCADACSFDLDRRDFALCLVPMQTLQLLVGSVVRTGGLLACAIATELESFDMADGSPGPSPETARVGEASYTSQATSVRVLPARIVIERERRIVSSEDDESCVDDPVHASAAEHNIVELARLSASELEREGAQAGLDPEPAREIAPTDEHVGSTVVMLRA